MISLVVQEESLSLLVATYGNMAPDCRTMLLLHWGGWRKISDIKDDNTTWNEAMTSYLSKEDCPNFMKADAEWVKKNQKTERNHQEHNMHRTSQ
jgi:hypothetical protein